MPTASYDLYKLGLECSPIILTGGVATLIPGQMLPIIAITEPLDLVNGLLSGMKIPSLDDVLCHYTFNPGTELARNEVATYPFANQTVAANSIIAQPKRVSLTMVCPESKVGGMFAKLAIITALAAVLDAHDASGGTYTVITPSRVYSNCLRVSFTNADAAATKQSQYQWQLEFMQPLLAQDQAASAQSSLMSKLSGQTQVTSPNWSSPSAVSAGAGSIQPPASASSLVQTLKGILGGMTP